MPNIVLNKIQHRFDRGHTGELLAIKNISLNIADGEFVAIVGPSGCGKTTLLRIIASLVEPTSGEVMIDGQSPRHFQESGKISFMFQSDTLLPWRNVYRNVALPFELADKNILADRINDMISLVDLRGFETKFPDELS